VAECVASIGAIRCAIAPYGPAVAVSFTPYQRHARPGLRRDRLWRAPKRASAGCDTLVSDSAECSLQNAERCCPTAACLGPRRRGDDEERGGVAHSAGERANTGTQRVHLVISRHEGT
jgi:hypothetical protein